MNWGLLILYILGGISLLLAAYEHGKTKNGCHNFWITLISVILEFTLILWAVGWRFI